MDKKKAVLKHLKEDMKTFDKEKKDDKKLIKKLSAKDKKKPCKYKKEKEND
jgi:hypothetical protein